MAEVGRPPEGKSASFQQFGRVAMKSFPPTGSHPSSTCPVVPQLNIYIILYKKQMLR